MSPGCVPGRERSPREEDGRSTGTARLVAHLLLLALFAGLLVDLGAIGLAIAFTA